MIDWKAFAQELGDIPFSDDPVRVKRRSRDFYWYSPVLKPQLDNVSGDLLVTPRSEEEVIRVASLCAKYRAPITIRGGGTGNYGQAMPLKGGVVLDITELNRVIRLEKGVLRVQAGAKMNAIDAETRPQGWELRMYPSTKRTATIGGFVCGGSGGIGSVGYGGLRETGNVIAARVVTVELEPRIIELRGEECNKINRTFGTTGIVTELEIPMAPALPWRDLVISFAEFGKAAEFGQALASASGVEKKLVSVIDWPLPRYFQPLQKALIPEQPIVIAMVAESGMQALHDLCRQFGGTIVFEQDPVEAEATPATTPLFEYTWNHTTLQILKADRSVTYLQSMFPPGRNLELVQAMRERFGDEVIMHMEFLLFDGKLTNSALQVVRYTTEERLNEIMDEHEANGIFIANPHVYTLEDGSRHKRVPGDQMGFKAEVDPFGLLNPGKMRSYVPVA
ncbi:FAD/FMN-containing dehydrogenase [Faunimonas pinastri]|uniref:FAD/FMN-containing dehydrogenase n=1 Tax=Faunimonas pinastri TaxID=1855383 RepID=A0A1H9M2E1_9HYPH|nr:FAD-binding oxidoreductase [Faunimonas pinastri]SER17774.1 FAD/FMN-containing dehydrogenase [Faunimonas pinastri]